MAYIAGMVKKNPETEPEQELTTHFVPGIGEVKAVSLDELAVKVKQLKEQEVGDDNI